MTTAPTPPALAIADLLEYLDDGGLKFDGQPLPDAAAAETFAAHELKRAFGTAVLPI